MALFSLTILPPPTSSLTLLHFSSSSSALCHAQHHRPFHSIKVLSLIRYPPRASLSSNDPTQPSDEEEFSQIQELPEEDSANSPTNPPPGNVTSVNSTVFSPNQSSDRSLINGALESESSSSSSATSPVNNVAALQFEKDLQRQEQLRETLATLSQSLALLSSSLSEVSSAVRVLAAALDNGQSQSTSSSSAISSPIPLSPPEMRDLREAEDREGSSWSVDTPEPWDNSHVLVTTDIQGIEGGGRTVGTGGERMGEEDSIPPYLVEQNRRAHKLAYRLQQAFIQARIEGLGKPFQVAVEEFAEACMEAHALGIGLKELQLQVVLQDGSLTGAFAIRNQRWSDDPILNEESRIRSLWIRLVYATLAQQFGDHPRSCPCEQLQPMESGGDELDPIDSFVKQVLQLVIETGYDLERLKLAQTFAGPAINSGAVKAMRENQYLILLTLEKAKSQNK